MNRNSLMQAAGCLLVAALGATTAVAETTEREMPTKAWSINVTTSVLTSYTRVGATYEQRFGDALSLEVFAGLAPSFHRNLYAGYEGIAPFVSLEGRWYLMPYRSRRQYGPSGLFIYATSESYMQGLMFLKSDLGKESAVSSMDYYNGLGLGYLYRPLRHFSLAAQISFGSMNQYFSNHKDYKGGTALAGSITSSSSYYLLHSCISLKYTF